jgi:hypothetical protein
MVLDLIFKIANDYIMFMWSYDNFGGNWCLHSLSMLASEFLRLKLCELI